MSEYLRDVGDTSECDGTKATQNCGLGPHSFAKIPSPVHTGEKQDCVCILIPSNWWECNKMWICFFFFVPGIAYFSCLGGMPCQIGKAFGFFLWFWHSDLFFSVVKCV